MTGEELKQVLRRWGLNAAQGAKVLCVHSNKLSEYLEDVSRIPCAVRFHVEALEQLPEDKRRVLIEQRVRRKAHEG
ncbi:hypothetical protein B1C78_08535 [Thioalkalivibrio denitrificans]|uniref:Transcriptional regulator n=1 Tax=Thioalkalivibrio denitrificans TaxID=108003 RepID=A0A1V3NHJ8_9GAMM|nr:hypothetical protein [Thioalkalivibrio denitrificans]OOG24541.1 hypothetical protein B1C78_08535 [Thioalkalivibrio denitrificans]